MRTLPSTLAVVASAAAFVFGCTLPVGGLAPGGGGAGGSLSSVSSAGGSTTTTTDSSTTASSTTSTTTSSATTVTSATSSTATGAQCMDSSGCPSGPCVTYACTMGQCVPTNAPDGTVIPDPGGNCSQTVCQAGNLLTVDDPSDFIEDGDPCTIDGCSGGAPTHVPKNEGDSCGANGLHCVGGKCIQCVLASECSALAVCTLPMCDNGSCVVVNSPEGLPCAPSNECSFGACMATMCSPTVNQPDGTNCSIGKCNGGECCAKMCGGNCCKHGGSCAGGMCPP